MSLTTEEIMHRVLWKVLEDTGMTDRPSMTDVPARDLLITLMPHWDGRKDVSRQAFRLNAEGKRLINELKADAPGEAAELAFAFGIELGRLLAKLEYPLAPDEVTELVAKRSRSVSNLKSAKDKAGGYEQIRKEAIREAEGRWHFFDTDNKVRVGEMAELVHDNLCNKYRKGHPLFDFVPVLPKKVADWIRPHAPRYAKKPGPSKKK